MTEPLEASGLLPIVMVVLDGASDRLGTEATPLERAWTPNLDALARRGVLGTMYTVGKGIAPESDAGVFSLLGYNPLETHLSRGIVEVIGAGVPFHDGNLALRAGFATVAGDKLVNRRAGRDLSAEEAVQLGDALNKTLSLKERVEFEFKSTVGHRAVVVFRDTEFEFSSSISNFDPAYVRKGSISVAVHGKEPFEIPNCDALDGSASAVQTAALVNEFGFKARKVLDRHPVNVERRSKGRPPANFVLMRDAGTIVPKVQGFTEKWGLDALMVADLPAELGIGRLLGMDVAQLPPGTSLGDYRRRALLVMERAGKYGFVYVHLKGPDEPGHDGLFDLKKKRIEEIDEGFFSILTEGDALERMVICVTCDHSTPWKVRGHSDDPVPVLIAAGTADRNGHVRFTEGKATGGSLGIIERGGLLMEKLKQYQF